MDKTSLVAVLKRMADDASLVKAVIQKEVSGGRVLVDEDTKHEVEQWLQIIGTDIATGEVLWNTLGRMSPHSKKFAVK